MRFPLKFQVGLYAAIVSAIALAIMPTIIRPFIYHQQLSELDSELKLNAEDIFEDLVARSAKGIDTRRPLTRDFIPQYLRLRFIRVWNRDGSEIYRSSNWKDFEPRNLPAGLKTVVIQARNCRVATLEKDNFWISIGTKLGTIEGMQTDLNFAFAVALPIVSVLVLAGAIWVARRALRPIADMTAAAERISVKHPKERLPVPDTSDEIERLSRVLNASFDRLEMAYAASERFSSAASHQLKTPLTILRAGLSELRGCDYLQPAERETVESLLQQTRRLTTMCEDLLLLAQADAGHLDIRPEALDIVPALRGAVDDMEVLGIHQNLKIQHDFPASLVVTADPRRIAIILQNLGENAVKYNRRDGSIRISIREEKERAIISIASTGPCIVPEDAERIFERFNRGATGENLKGHGLGLSIARELARAHGGDLRLARSDENWTEFELVLPLAPPSA